MVVIDETKTELTSADIGTASHDMPLRSSKFGGGADNHTAIERNKSTKYV
jgi:hypothetical protein